MGDEAAKHTSGSTPAYLSPYEEAARSFGASFEATLWSSKDKQLKRFQVMAQMLDLENRVIVDAGCGLGDFAAWMHDQGIRYEAYIGIEGVAEMAGAAQERNLPRAEIIEGDFAGHKGFFEQLAQTHPFDIAVFSGSLNTFEPKQVRRLIGRAWKAARVGVGFNFLSTRNGRPAGETTGPARRFDPVPMVHWALKRTPNVRFRQDYFQGHDATLAMTRGVRGVHGQLPGGMV